MPKGFRDIVIKDEHGVHPDTKICVISSEVALAIQDTFWFRYIKGVSAEAMGKALHGYATPLMQEIGPEPRHIAKKLNRDHNLQCANLKDCMIAGDVCIPGDRTPLCYVPPGVPAELQQTINLIVLAWKQGQYVVYILGEEDPLW